MKELIVAPAIRKNNEVRISRFCHAELIDTEYFFRGAEQGFVTNLNRFVDRKEALQIARNAKQELHKWCDTDELYSEDIFWNPFEEENEENKKAFENFKKYSKKIFDDYEDMFIELQEQEKIINLMLSDLSHFAFYMDGYESHCEVKEKECNNENIDCINCLLKYYKDKVKRVANE